MYFDSHRGEYITPNRQFSPRLGRWTQPDPFWNIGNMQDSPIAILQSANLFVFTMNNPVMWADPTGLFSERINEIQNRLDNPRNYNQATINHLNRELARAYQAELTRFLGGAQNFTQGLVTGVFDGISLGATHFMVDQRNETTFLIGRVAGNLVSVAIGIHGANIGGAATGGLAVSGAGSVAVPATGAFTVYMGGVAVSGAVHAGVNISMLVSGGGGGGSGSSVRFGSDAKSGQRLANQMSQRGWTEDTVRSTVNNPHTTRSATNRATGNSATAFFNRDGSHVIVDNTTREIVQVSNRFDLNWIPDSSIISPFRP